MAKDFLVLRGTLRVLNTSIVEDARFDDCGSIGLIMYWRPFIQSANGDVLPVSVEELHAPHDSLQLGAGYMAVLCPVPYGRKMQAYFEKNFARLFPIGQTFPIGSCQNAQAQFTVEGYDTHKMCFALRPECVLVLALNHHLPEMQVAQFEDFYANTLRGNGPFSSKMKEATAANRTLPLAERLENLRDDYGVDFSTSEAGLDFDWCLGRRALRLAVWAPGGQKDIAIMCRYERYGVRAHRARMRLAEALIKALHSVFRENVLLGIWNDHPVGAIQELVSEGMDIHGIVAHCANEYPPPARISLKTLLATPEDALHIWYIISPHYLAAKTQGL